MKNITDIFLGLVAIDSPSGNEIKMSLFLQKWLHSLNFIFRIDTVGNIYAKNNKKGSPLLLCAHMDTVQPGENIKALVKNGVIQSNGKTILGADNKAAIAAIMAAVEKNNKRSLELLFTVKEETGSGIEFFPFTWIQSKKALIFDSAKPLGGIILRSPYIYNFNATFLGKAAHASLPQEGINAFSPAIQALQQIKVGFLDNNETTINIGLIKGGMGINTIPPKVNVSGEVRSYDKKLFKKHLDHIKTIFEKEVKNTEVKLNFTVDGYCAGYTYAKNDTFIKQIDAMYKNIGLETTFYEYSGISDANVLGEHGIQAVNLTDGTKYAHTTKEQITVNDLNKLSEIIKKCITEL